MRSSTLISTTNLNLSTPEGRQVVNSLNMQIACDQVAIVGRNGVGKSTLVRALSAPETIKSIHRTEDFFCVYQDLNENVFNSEYCLIEPHFSVFDESERYKEFAKIGVDTDKKHLSQGELRKINLVYAKLCCPALLLLDEPTSDLDKQGIRWLIDWLTSWQGGLIVVTHNQQLQTIFSHYFILEESGCRYFNGSNSELQVMLAREQHNQQERYVSQLNNLLRQENRADRINQRRQQKRNQGRLRELGRMTSRQRLNSKKSWAQESQSRVANISQEKRDSLASMVKAARKQLKIGLPLALSVPSSFETTGKDFVAFESVSIEPLFHGVSMSLTRQRIAITGENGSGKTSLVQLMLGIKKPDSGCVRLALQNAGYISQNADNWRLEQSLFEYLWERIPNSLNDDVMSIIVTHKFPLGLAEKPMRDLSSGERLRAALICLFSCNHQQLSPMDYLVLDEPKVSLDSLGYASLKEVLNLWQGGLIIVSHDKSFLEDLNIGKHISLSNRELYVEELVNRR